MAQENVTTVQAAFEAMERGGLDALAEYWTDDVDHRAIEGSIDDRGPMHGNEAVYAYLQDWFDMFDDFTVKPVELIDAGDDHVVAVLRIGGRAKQSGVETELTFATVYTIRRGEDRTRSRVRDSRRGPRSRRAQGVGQGSSDRWHRQTPAGVRMPLTASTASPL